MVTSRDALLPAELARRFRDLRNLDVEPRTLGDLFARGRSQAPQVEHLFSSEPTRHEVIAGTRRGYTHCAMDAFLLPFLLDEAVDLRSASPQSGIVIEARLSVDGLQISHPDAVMSYGVACEGDGPAQTVACPFINLFPSEAEYELWSSAHPEAMTVAILAQDAFVFAQQRGRGGGSSQA